MSRTVNILLLICLLAVGINLAAQQKAKGTAKRLFVPPAYLGRSELKGGPIKKAMFDELLRQGITSHDSLGNLYKVVGFQFAYSERSVYEDSVGNLQALMDYSFEYCPGDTITSTIAESIYERTKPGDTLYFDRISVVKISKNAAQTQPESESFAARGMKFYIVK